MKNFSRFASCQVPGKGGNERYFCKRCLNSFPRVESLEKHKEICGEFAAAKIELPGGKCSFKNWERMMHIPVVGYADFESIFEALFGRKQNSRAYSLRILFSFGFSIFANGTRVEKSGNETNQLPQDFIRELISRVKEAHLSLPKRK